MKKEQKKSKLKPLDSADEKNKTEEVKPKEETFEYTFSKNNFLVWGFYLYIIIYVIELLLSKTIGDVPLVAYIVAIAIVAVWYAKKYNETMNSSLRKYVVIAESIGPIVNSIISPFFIIASKNPLDFNQWIYLLEYSAITIITVFFGYWALEFIGKEYLQYEKNKEPLKP